jgi:leucine dehydrogenase
MTKYEAPMFHTIEGYEKVMEFRDQATQLHGFIAIHNTKRGPALGGTRLWQYHTADAALTDVLRLAKGMTYKAAGANLALGGGKAVLIGDAKTIKSPAYFHAYGHYVDLLAGQYITAEDVNTNTQDMMAIAQVTPHVVGREGKSGNPSPFTAYGVYVGLLTTIQEQFPNRPIESLKFAIQGVGQTGGYLLKHLVDAGVRNIVVSDINPIHLQTMRHLYPFVKVVPQEQLLSESVDVLCPCALGGILNDASLQEIQAKVIAGSANNILLDDRRHGPMAKAKGILVAPDFIINAGGLINVYHEHHLDYIEAEVNREILNIQERLSIIYALAKKENMDPFLAAIKFANNQLK